MSEHASPPVSIVLPARQERRYITDCLDSLEAQDYPNITEIIVVDGESSDGTRSLVERRGPRVRLIDNPGLTAAAAMNRGLAAACNEIVVRVDAHTHYETDYVRSSVEALLESGADWVGGPMRPVGTTSFGRAVAAVTSSPLGVGPGRFHYATDAQDVDTVYLGTFRRSIVMGVGGYDEVDLQWAAEDHELNHRLRKAGRRIRLDPRIRSTYFPRSTVGSLWRQYFNYGVCKASTLRKHRSLPHWRPLVPAAMVAGCALIAVGGVAARRPSAGTIPILAYAAGASVVGYRLSDNPGVAPHRATVALVVCHWAYGAGFWAGIGRIVTGRAFENRPGGSR